MDGKKLTVGYIGNGKSTNRYHLPYIRLRTNTYRVKTIFDAHLGHPIYATFPDIIYTDKIEDILLDNEIDLVIICRIDQHFEYAKMVLEHGKHCMVEKPFMNNEKDAREIYTLAEEKGLIIQPYQNRRFDSDFLTLQKVIESGKLGELLELEMHFDYYRPEIPEGITTYKRKYSYLYGHACHTIDQVISFFGKPDFVHYDVRQLLGTGRMNDYFDIDLYYGVFKVSVKSSYFRIKERPSMVIYGKKGCFEKYKKDRQEEHLKLFYMPGQSGFGQDRPEDYGIVTYMDDRDNYHEEKVVSIDGDYGRVYDDLYKVIVDGKKQVITKEQILCQMNILETGIQKIEKQL